MFAQHSYNIPAGANGKALAHESATSSTLAPSSSARSEGSNQRLSASRAFRTASSSVSPALAQPGSSGKIADQRCASASNWTINLSFISGLYRLRDVPQVIVYAAAS